MRISDWSSDVCSSDLNLQVQAASHPAASTTQLLEAGNRGSTIHLPMTKNRTSRSHPLVTKSRGSRVHLRTRKNQVKKIRLLTMKSLKSPIRRMKTSRRSEEHTSELQSLMRISYDVFCLKKNKK